MSSCHKPADGGFLIGKVQISVRFSYSRIQELQALLKEHYGLEYDEQQAQQAGLNIVRFIIAKNQRLKQQLAEEGENGTEFRTK